MKGEWAYGKGSRFKEQDHIAEPPPRPILRGHVHHKREAYPQVLNTRLIHMNKNYYQILGSVLVGAFLGTTALLVSFVVASAAEHSAVGEIVAACIAAGLYLAFCEFWIAPRGTRFLHKVPSLLAVLAPSLAAAHWWTRPVPWLVSACFGALAGALLAQMVTFGHRVTVLERPAVNGRSKCRSFLLAGFIMLLAVALLILVGVVPSVLADTAPGFNSGPAGSFLAVTVLFSLLAALLAASSLWRHQGNDPLSKATLGMIAFVALFLTLVYAGSIVVGAQHPGMRTAGILLAISALLALVVTTLVTIISVMVDRARLSAP